MGEERSESGPAPRAAALHGSGGHIEDAGCLRHGVALHVHQDQCGALLGGKSGEGCQKLSVQILAFGGRFGGLVGLKELFEPLGVVDGEVLRDAALRTRSRQALTVMRCSQVVTADWPRKVWAARKAETKAS